MMNHVLALHQKRSKRILTLNSILFKDVFFATVEVIYFLKVLHLSFSEFATITSISVLTSMIAEIPTGIISDYFGRKEMLLLGTAIDILGTTAMILLPIFHCTAFFYILYIQIIIILEDALASGNFEVLIYDYCMACHLSEHQFKEMSSSLFSKGAILSAIIGLLSTLLFNFNHYLPLIFDIGIQCLKFISFLWIPSQLSNKDRHRVVHINTTKNIHQISKMKNILVVLLLFSVIFAISRSTFSLYQPMMTSHHLSLTAYGILTVIINLTVFIIIHYTKITIEKSRIPLISILVLLLQLMLLIVPMLKNSFLIFLMFTISFSLMQILRVISEGLSSFFINKEIENESNRTFYFSLYKTGSSLLLACYFGLSSVVNHFTGNYIYTYLIECFISVLVLGFLHVRMKKYQ